jgi:hypothetical protein
LLQIKIDGAEVTCRQLVESKQHIGSIFVPHAPGPDGIFFFSGEYHLNAPGIPVPNNQLSVLRDGKVIHLKGPTFLSVSRLAQISDNRFLALTDKVYFSDAPANRLRNPIDDYLAEIEIGDESIEARYVDFFNPHIGTLSDLNSLPGAGVGFMGTYNFSPGGRHDYVTTFELSGEGTKDTIALPIDRDFSSVFGEIENGDQIVVRLLSVDRATQGRDRLLMMSDLSGPNLINSRMIGLTPTVTFNTANCAAAEVTF